jgi:hypothetical protein
MAVGALVGATGAVVGFGPAVGTSVGATGAVVGAHAVARAAQPISTVHRRNARRDVGIDNLASC